MSFIISEMCTDVILMTTAQVMGVIARNIYALLGKYCCTGKAIIEYSESLCVAWGTQHVMRMRNIVISLSWPVLQHFSTFSYKRYDIRKEKIIEMKCVWYSLNFSETFLILIINQPDTIFHVHSFYVKYPLLLSDFLKLEFSQQIVEKYSNFMKIPPVRADMLHADGWTDGKIDTIKLFVTFLNFAHKPKIEN
jgi:hypothetical protein